MFEGAIKLIHDVVGYSPRSTSPDASDTSYEIPIHVVLPEEADDRERVTEIDISELEMMADPEQGQNDNALVNSLKEDILAEFKKMCPAPPGCKVYGGCGSESGYSDANLGVSWGAAEYMRPELDLSQTRLYDI